MWLKSIQILRITAVLFCLLHCMKIIDTNDLCNKTEKNDHLLFVDDGYKGVIQCCGNVTNVNCSPNHGSDQTVVVTTLHSLSSAPRMKCSKSNQMCYASILSFDTNLTEGSCGIEIQKVGQSYYIHLEFSQVPIIHFLPGYCDITKAMRLKSCASQFNGHLCKHRPENEKFIFINATEENQATCMYEKRCVTCKNPVKEPKIIINLEDSIVVSTNGEVDATAAANAMKTLSSVLKRLGNETSARITMGPIKGILKKQGNTGFFKKAFFGLSSEIIQDVEDVTALEDPLPGLISVSEEAFYKANLSNRDVPFVAVFSFPNMTKDANDSTLFNSLAIAIEMAAEIRNLTDPINITFLKPQADAKMSCSSWNGEGDRPVWTTDGCDTLESNDSITCQCTHLTFFAILLTSPGMNISSSELNSLTYITYIGCGLSMFFLGVALFMHFLLRRTKASYATLILMNLFLAMFLLNLSFLSNNGVANLGNPIACKIIAAAMHYSMLSTFSWFAVEGFHLCSHLIKSQSSFHNTVEHYMLKVCIAGWVLPCVVTSTLFGLGKYGSLTINSDNEKPVKMCWIIDSTVHYVVNIGYYAVVFVFTFVVFIVIATRLMHTKQMEAGATKKGTRLNIFSILGLCCLLGITWGFAFFSHGPFRIPSYYIFTILNSFQGFYLFLYYYNTSKIAGEEQASSSSTQTTNTSNTILDTFNPYLNEGPKTKS
ncbi:adhesion G-protein coupled receptor G2-like isoform X2 [Conger conger]|uniref:adhesion G-protein coupled receptor G2-like isoform X2 n=1 Tax=Conger conger TaxID=82655 RepID=UPI002A59DC8D|nr:adhesion G-protein coupled receptor G2-like isoform X2 [Conger conger]